MGTQIAPSGTKSGDKPTRTVRAHKLGIERRELILDAAVNIFAEYGYRATTISTIAKKAGITDAGVLHHFRSKSELFEAVVSLRQSPFLDIFTSGAQDGHELIDAFVKAIKLSLERPDLVRFQAALGGELQLPGHPFHDSFRTDHNYAVQALSEQVERLQHNGAVDAHLDPRRAAGDLIALHRGLRSEWMLAEEEIDFPEAFRQAALAILHYSTAAAPATAVSPGTAGSASTAGSPGTAASPFTTA